MINGKLYIAGPFEDEDIQKIQEHFTALLGQQVVLSVQRDDRLLGGFLATVDGKVYDASLLVRMKGIRQHILSEE
jgi:F0F1-type ATP synthase delta subunit